MDKPQNVLSVNELIKLAEQAFEEFSPGIAAKYLQDAIKQKPNDADLYHKLALMCVECGDPEQAHKISIYSLYSLRISKLTPINSLSQSS